MSNNNDCVNNDYVDYSSNLINTCISTTTILKLIKLKPLKLERQTHLYCKNCSACQSEYGKLFCNKCGISMFLKNKLYV